MNFGNKTTTTDTAYIDLNQTYSTNIILDQELYEKDLKQRQEQHLARVQTKRPWQPCMHDQCQSCHGTGINAFGGACIHSISCPCPKCTPRC